MQAPLALARWCTVRRRCAQHARPLQERVMRGVAPRRSDARGCGEICTRATRDAWVASGKP
eukprot:2413293-Pyramimonas_sp.AAC.1